MKKIIAAIAVLAALIFAVGTIGSFVAANITFAQCFFRVAICAIIEGISLKVLD